MDPQPLLDQTLAYLETRTGLILGVVAVLVFALAACRAFAKAGFPATAGLLLLLPGLNLFVFLWFAFAPWPLRRERRALRKVQRVVHRGDERRDVA